MGVREDECYNASIIRRNKACMNENAFSGFMSHRGIRIALVSALSVLTLFLFVQSVMVVKSLGRSSVPATDTITVQGNGEAVFPPDVAHISFTVQNTAATVAEAQSLSTKQTNAAIEFVKGQKVAEKDVRTLSYNISPQYSYPNPCRNSDYCPQYTGSPKITGYQVSQTMQVTVRDLTQVGAMLAGLGKLEVQNISGPAFALDDERAGYDAARADAIDKAKVQAKALAKQLGVRLGDIVNFSESSGGYPMYRMGYGGAAEAKMAPTPNIPSGENTYSASVSITYEIR